MFKMLNPIEKSRFFRWVDCVLEKYQGFRRGIKMSSSVNRGKREASFCQEDF